MAYWIAAAVDAAVDAAAVVVDAENVAAALEFSCSVPVSRRDNLVRSYLRLWWASEVVWRELHCLAVVAPPASSVGVATLPLSLHHCCRRKNAADHRRLLRIERGLVVPYGFVAFVCLVDLGGHRSWQR